MAAKQHRNRPSRPRHQGRKKAKFQKNIPPSHENRNEIWIWGIHPVLELLKLRPQEIVEINILDTKANEKILQIEELAASHKIQQNKVVRLVNEEKGSHQGVEAKIKPITFLSFSELLQKTRQNNQPLLIALDSIQDPHNLGAIIRSASAAGVDGIILPKDRSAPISGTVAKTAVGALAMVNLCQVTNISETLKKLKTENFWIYGADGGSEDTVYNSDFKGPVCIVVGSEGKGMRPLVKKECDLLISIPMHSSLDSLNASVASAVILFEVVRQRKQI